MLEQEVAEQQQGEEVLLSMVVPVCILLMLSIAAAKLWLR